MLRNPWIIRRWNKRFKSPACDTSASTVLYQWIAIATSLQVLNEGICVDTNRCVACDEKHYAGDSWKTDNCTRCECLYDGTATCHRKGCDQITCPLGFDVQIVNMDEDGCCPVLTCGTPSFPLKFNIEKFDPFHNEDYFCSW